MKNKQTETDIRFMCTYYNSFTWRK